MSSTTAPASALPSGSLSSVVSSALSSAASTALSITSSASQTSSSATTSATVTPASKLLEDQNGSAQKQEGVSLETFLASLAVAAIIFGVEVLLFVMLRKKLHRIYEPRTYLVPDKCVEP